MDAFKAAYLNEIYKILKRKKLIVAASLSLLAVILGTIAVYGIQQNVGLRIAGGSEFPILLLSILSYTLIPLFTVFVAVDLFGGEFSANTMKVTLTRPASRFTIYCAKVMAVATFILANLLFILLFSTILGGIFSRSPIQFGRVFVSYIMALLPLFTFSLLSVMISNVFRGSVSAFMAAVVVFVVLNVLTFLFYRYQIFFLTSTFDWHMLFVSSYINIQKILREFIIMVSCAIMFFTIGYMQFERKEL